LLVSHAVTAGWNIQQFGGGPDMYKMDSAMTEILSQYSGKVSSFTTDPETYLIRFDPIIESPLPTGTAPSGCTVYRRSIQSADIYAVCGTDIYLGEVEEDKLIFEPKFDKSISVTGAKRCVDVGFNLRDLVAIAVCESNTAGNVIFVEINMQDFTEVSTTADQAFAAAGSDYSIAVLEADSSGNSLMLFEAGETFKGTAYQWQSGGTVADSFDYSSLTLPSGGTILGVDAVVNTLAVRRRTGASAGAYGYGIAICTADWTNKNVDCPTSKDVDLPGSSLDGSLMIVNNYEIDRVASIMAYALLVTSDDKVIKYRLEAKDGSIRVYANSETITEIPVSLGFDTLTEVFFRSGNQYMFTGLINNEVYIAGIRGGDSAVAMVKAEGLTPTDPYFITNGYTTSFPLIFYGFQDTTSYYSNYNPGWLTYSNSFITEPSETTTISFVANLPDGTTDKSDPVTFTTFRDFIGEAVIHSPNFFSIYTGTNYVLPVQIEASNGATYKAENTEGSVVATITTNIVGTVTTDARLQAEEIESAFALEDHHFISNTISSTNTLIVFACNINSSDQANLECNTVTEVDVSVVGSATDATVVSADFFLDHVFVWVVYTEGSDKKGVIIKHPVSGGNAVQYTYTGEKEAHALRAQSVDGDFVLALVTSEQKAFGKVTTSEFQVVKIASDQPAGEITWDTPDVLNYGRRMCVYKFQFRKSREELKFFTGSDCSESGTQNEIRASNFGGNKINLGGAKNREAMKIWCVNKNYLNFPRRGILPLRIHHQTLETPNAYGYGTAVSSLEDYNNPSIVNHLECPQFENFFYVNAKPEDGNEQIVLFDASQIWVNNRKRVISTFEAPTEFQGQTLGIVSDPARSVVHLFTPKGKFSKTIAIPIDPVPMVELDASASTEEGVEDLVFSVTNSDGSSTYGSTTTRVNVFTPFTSSSLTKKEGTEIKVEGTSGQTFILEEYFDFHGPVIDVKFNSDSSGSNVLLSRQRPIDTPFAYLQDEYTGVNVNGENAIVWSDSEVTFVLDNQGASEVIQSILGAIIAQEIFQLGNGAVYSTIASNAGAAGLHANMDGTAMTLPLSTDFANGAKIVQLNSAESSFIVLWYLESDMTLNFQKYTISNNQLVEGQKVTQQLTGKIFDFTCVNTNNNIIVAYTLQNDQKINFVTVGDAESQFTIKGTSNHELDLESFNTMFYGKTGRISCSAGATAESLECAMSDSVFFAFLVDVALDENSLATSMTATNSFIIPAGFSVRSMSRQGTAMFWTGVKDSSTKLPKLGTVLDKAYLLLVYKAGESDHAVMTLTPDDTGVPIEKFDTLTPFFSLSEEQKPIFNYNSGGASATGALNAILVTNFEWTVNEPEKVDFNKDIFEVDGYDPEEKQEIPIDGNVEDDRPKKGGNLIGLLIALCVVLLIVVFVCCCVYGAGKRRRKKKRDEEESIVMRDIEKEGISKPLMGADTIN
jgi:hypothetical protein